MYLYKQATIIIKFSFSLLVLRDVVLAQHIPHNFLPFFF